MDSQLTLALARWSQFFVAAAGASAVLLGLVFIGLTIHLDGREERPALVPLSVTSATTLFYPVIISLTLLIPPAQPIIPTAALILIALFATLSAASPILQSDLRALWITERKVSDWLRYVVPAVAGLCLVGAAVWLTVDPAQALYVIALVIIVYVVVGTQNAWNVLLAGRFDVGAWTVKRTHRKDADGH